LPGVPDFYQGTESWEFSLVDPDNRRPVDFIERKKLMAEIREGERGDLIDFIERMMQQPEDGRIKMYLIRRALNYRREQYELFATGDYQPVRIVGNLKNHVIAFSRNLRNKSVIVAAGRFFSRFTAPDQLSIIQDTWNGTFISMEKNMKFCRYRNIFTGEVISLSEQNNKCRLPLVEVFSHLPVAIMELA
jgi:(1->4)-alpha-D-glucan 1-alpha-D-glucosylmutase